MKAALAKGPVAVAVDAMGYAFELYMKGIMDGKCGTDLDHAVTAVGYGNKSGKEFLIVRNSWGTDWGEKGYFRAAFDKDGPGVCGILLDSSRPNTD